MAWDGSGTFTRTNGTNTGATTWADDAAAATKILSTRHDTHDEDLATGLNAALTQNNESKPTAHFLPNADASYNFGSAVKQWVAGFFSGDVTAQTFAATGDTAAADNASMGYTATEGLILTGQGSTNDVTIKNDADADVMTVPTGTTRIKGSAGDEIYGQFTIKASDESVTSSTTLQDDDDLQFTAVASGVYDVEIAFTALSTSSTPDIKCVLQETDGAFLIVGHNYGGPGVSSPDSLAFSATNSAITIPLIGNAVEAFHLKGIYTAGGSGGVFKFQWAQGTSDGTATTVQAGSWMRALKIA